MTNHPRFSIVIVNYNGGAYLKGALASLAAQTVTDFEVFVVDNASTDASMAAVLSQYGDANLTNQQTLGLPSLTKPGTSAPLHIRPQAKNLGFAAANNLVAKEATGEWLVLLNPDAEAAPDWLEKLAAAISRHPSVSMFASTQIDLHDPETLDGAGDAYFGFGIPWRGGFGRPLTELPAEGTCFSPCGAGAIYRRDLFLDHGGFDERFFCFCEDVDLGYRLRLAGEQCVFLPDAIIRHAGGGLTGRASEFSLYHGARNRLWTYIKNTPLRLLIPTLPVHAALILAILFRNRKTDQNKSVLRGLRDGLTGLGPFLSERKSLKQRRKVSVFAISSAMCWNLMKLRRRQPDVRAFKDKR